MFIPLVSMEMLRQTAWYGEQAAHAGLLAVPDEALQLVLCQLQERDLAATRLCCKQLARVAALATTRATSLCIQHRDLQTYLPIFANLRQLQVRDALAARCAEALPQLTSLNITGKHSQPVSALLALTNLVSLRALRSLKQPEQLRLLPSLQRLSFPNSICNLAHVATGLHSLTCKVLGPRGSCELLGRKDDSVLQLTQLMGLTSLHVEYISFVDQDLAFEVIAQLTNLQKVYHLGSLFTPGPIRALRSLISLYVGGPWSIPTLPMLTYLGWKRSTSGDRMTPATWQQSLAGFEQLKELDLDLVDHMNASADLQDHEEKLVLSIPSTVTSLLLSGVFDDGPRWREGLSHLEGLRILSIENYHASLTELLHDPSTCILAPGCQQLLACRVRNYCFDNHQLLHDWTSARELPLHSLGGRYATCFETWHE